MKCDHDSTCECRPLYDIPEGLILVSKDTYAFAVKCRDKYIGLNKGKNTK